MNQHHKTTLLKGLMIISGALTLLSAFGDAVLLLILKTMFQVNVPKGEAAAVGIIGGADGPTVVFIAGKTLADYKAVSAMISFAVFMGCLVQLRKYKRSLR